MNHHDFFTGYMNLYTFIYIYICFVCKASTELISSAILLAISTALITIVQHVIELCNWILLLFEKIKYLNLFVWVSNRVTDYIYIGAINQVQVGVFKLVRVMDCQWMTAPSAIIYILIGFSMKFIHNFQFDTEWKSQTLESVRVQMMAWYRTGSKTIYEPLINNSIHWFRQQVYVNSLGSSDAIWRHRFGQHWLRLWSVAWRHQAITWTNVDLRILAPNSEHFHRNSAWYSFKYLHS